MTYNGWYVIEHKQATHSPISYFLFLSLLLLKTFPVLVSVFTHPPPYSDSFSLPTWFRHTSTLFFYLCHLLCIRFHHSLSLSLSLSLFIVTLNNSSYTIYLPLSFSTIISHIHTHTHTLSLSHTHSLSLSLSLTHTHTHTHSLSLSLSFIGTLNNSSHTLYLPLSFSTIIAHTPTHRVSLSLFCNNLSLSLSLSLSSFCIMHYSLTHAMNNNS